VRKADIPKARPSDAWYEDVDLSCRQHSPLRDWPISLQFDLTVHGGHSKTYVMEWINAFDRHDPGGAPTP